MESPNVIGQLPLHPGKKTLQPGKKDHGYDIMLLPVTKQDGALFTFVDLRVID